MFNFKKIGKKVLSSVLGATLAMGSFLNTQIVKADESDREKYWDPYTMLSLAGFILGEDKKYDIEKLKKEFEKELSTKLSKEFEKKLSTKLPNGKFVHWTDNVRAEKILEIENNLVVCQNGLKSRLENKLDNKGKKVYDAVKEFITDEKADFGKLNSIGELKEIKNFGDGLECKIATFGNENETQKAIVGVSVYHNGTFDDYQMDQIFDKLLNLELKEVDEDDFKNVYLIIRPFIDEDFFINYGIMEDLKNATVVTSGATFNNGVTIPENNTIIANRTSFYKDVTVKAGGHLIVNRAKSGENVDVEKGGNLTTINAFFEDIIVNGNLNAYVENFYRNVTVNGNLTANGARFWESVTVNGDNLTVDISNAEFECKGRCTINAQDSKINLTGCDFSCIEFGRGCANLKITVSDNKVDKFFQTYKDKVLGSNVFKSINKVTCEEIINLNSKYPNNSKCFLNEFKKLKQQKEEEEQQQNNNGTNKSTTSTSQQQQPKPKPQPQNNNGNKTDDNKIDDNKIDDKNNNEIEIVNTTTTNSNNEINNISQNNNNKEEGFIKKHPVISCTIGTLLTGIVVTPLVVFRNRIIKGIESIFGKNQIKKPVAKRIKATN